MLDCLFADTSTPTKQNPPIKVTSMKYPALFIGMLLQLGAFLLFCKGFFPTKVLLTPNEVEQFTTDSPVSYKEPDAIFDKVVIMVVDAMRSDFLFSNHSNMHFAHQLLNSGFGVGLTAFSNPPTVTLPRLKGITTGSTPNFIDAVLNIAEDDTSSSLGDQDSWIKQMYLNDWKINMFGDDTWLKLFPNYFSKHEGTASFYVSDFTIVDNNVTRHLDYELSEDGQANWDCLILHYLGLDHIGHKGGPNSQNMPGKQYEMDNIIQRIHKEFVMKDPNTLFVVLGDHGMNDIGNHGGSSTAETSAALMLMSQKFENHNLNDNSLAPIEWNEDFTYYSRVDQIDLVPTLATMIGLPIPINNLGTFITKFLEVFPNDVIRKNVLFKNALQLKVLLDKKFNREPEPLLANMSIPELLQFLAETKEILLKTSSDYDYKFINLGLGLYTLITLISYVTFGLYFKGHFCVAFFDVVFFFVYAVNFIASSMVEEEHHLWWFFTTIFMAFVILKKLRSENIKWYSIVLMMIGLRVLKAWNNSGQKHNLKSNMKLSTYLSQLPPNIGPNVYIISLFLTLLPLLFMINAYTKDGVYLKIMQILIAMLSFLIGSLKMLSYLTETYNINNTILELPCWCIKFIFTTKKILELEDFNKINNMLYNLSQKVWLAAFVLQLLQPRLMKLFTKSSVSSKSYFINILAIISFILISQTNYLNVPIFVSLYLILFGFIENAQNSSINSNIFNLFTILLQNLTFFQFGSTNSLSSVDLTNSFNGLTSYNVFLSGLLTYTCNWAGPIFWTVAHLYIVYTKLSENQIKANKWKILYDKLLFNFVFYSTSGMILLVCCYHLRFHLFIWTVFSPKILYFLSWLVCNLIFDFLASIVIVACSG